MKARTQNRYSKDFRAAAVARTLKPGAQIAVVSRELGIGDWTLRRWVSEAFGEGVPATTPPGEGTETEVVRLRRELARVTAERDFLKKVSAFFAKESL